MLRSLVNANPINKRQMRQRVRVMRGPKPSKKNELWYKAELLIIVKRMRDEVTTELLPLIKQLSPLWVIKDSDPVIIPGIGFGCVVRPIGDGYTADVNDQIDKLAAKFGGMKQQSKRLAAIAAKRSQVATDAQLTTAIKNSVKVDISPFLSHGPIAEVMDKNIIVNTELISSLPDQYMQRIRSTVMAGMQSGQRWEEIAKSISEDGDVTEGRAKLIARDQMSKMNASFNEARQTSLGIEEYVWSGAMDERERDTHMANEGRTFRWDDPPATTGNPGDDVNCRCVALPKFDLDAMEERLGL